MPRWQSSLISTSWETRKTKATLLTWLRGRLVVPAKEPSSFRITRILAASRPWQWSERLSTSWTLPYFLLKGSYGSKSSERKIRGKGKLQLEVISWAVTQDGTFFFRLFSLQSFCKGTTQQCHNKALWNIFQSALSLRKRIFKRMCKSNVAQQITYTWWQARGKQFDLFLRKKNCTNIWSKYPQAVNFRVGNSVFTFQRNRFCIAPSKTFAGKTILFLDIMWPRRIQ